MPKVYNFVVRLLTTARYSQLSNTYEFVPVELVQEIRRRTANITGDAREQWRRQDFVSGGGTGLAS